MVIAVLYDPRYSYLQNWSNICKNFIKVFNITKWKREIKANIERDFYSYILSKTMNIQITYF